MPEVDLKARTKAFALSIIRLVNGLPSNRVAETIGRQLLRAATSVAANYRSACRARSRRDFIAKMAIVEEESDETQFWLEILGESGLFGGEGVETLRDEAGQLVAITVASIRTARRTPRSIPQSAFPIPHSR